MFELDHVSTHVDFLGGGARLMPKGFEVAGVSPCNFLRGKGTGRRLESTLGGSDIFRWTISRDRR